MGNVAQKKVKMGKMGKCEKMRYGLPYQGSKNKIAEWICGLLPPGRRLVELFAGGCAVTHCAMATFPQKWERHLACDVLESAILFRLSLLGMLGHELTWVSREDFKQSTDLLTRILWSFAHNLRRYLYNPSIEPLKRAMHLAVTAGCLEPLCEISADVADEFSYVSSSLCDITLRRRAMERCISSLLPLDADGRWRGNKPEHLKRLQHLEWLDRLRELGTCGLSVDSLDARISDYGQYSWNDGDVVYADPPYGTEQFASEGYGWGSFDREEFIEWVRTRDFPVFVSEYDMPCDFVSLGVRTVQCSYSQYLHAPAKERLFIHHKFIHKWFAERR